MGIKHRIFILQPDGDWFRVSQASWDNLQVGSAPLSSHATGATRSIKLAVVYVEGRTVLRSDTLFLKLTAKGHIDPRLLTPDERASPPSVPALDTINGVNIPRPIPHHYWELHWEPTELERATLRASVLATMPHLRMGTMGTSD